MVEGAGAYRGEDAARDLGELPTTYYLLPTTYYLLPTTYYLLLTTFYLLLTAYYLLTTTDYLPQLCKHVEAHGAGRGWLA